jgi:hypothetical protein
MRAKGGGRSLSYANRSNANPACLAVGRWLNVDPDIEKSAQNFDVRQGVTREWQSTKRSATLTGTIRLPCADSQRKKELIGQVRADRSIGL